MRCLTILALSALLGCAAERYAYAPVRTTGAEIAGEPAAVYALPLGEVRVATFGIAKLRTEDADESIVHAVSVTLVVMNRSADTWAVDGAEQRLAFAGWGDVVATSAHATRAARIEVPPQSTRWIDVYFPLPAGLEDARALPAFELAWTVHAGSRIVSERTSFERFRREAAPRPLRDEERVPYSIPGTEASPLPGSEPPDRWPPPHQPQ